MSRIAKNVIPQGLALRPSQGAVSDPGITYNEVGVTYNDSRYTYGGFYGYTDVKPLFSQAINIMPRIIGSDDLYTPFSSNAKIPIGPGFFMFITYT